jgi:thermitase
LNIISQLKYAFIFIIIIVGFLSLILLDTPSAPNLGKPLGPAGNFIVCFKPGISHDEIQEIYHQTGAVLEKDIPQIGAQIIKMPLDAAARDRFLPYLKEVYSVEPDSLVRPAGIPADTPNDVGFSRQWALIKIQAPQAWNITHGSNKVKIAILDSGIDSNHPDLASKVVANKNFSDSPTLEDKYGHGTHVAGIAAANTNNRIGIAGSGYNSSLMNVKVLGDGGGGAYSWIIQGIIWAADNGANVINLSMCGDVDSPAMKQAVDYAWNKGLVVVTAASNNGKSIPSYPAAYDNSLAVAATDAEDHLCAYSDWGTWVDVAAPGSSFSTLPGNNYAAMGGTSMAAPYVSGLAALAFTLAVDTNGDGKVNDEIRAAIQNGCDNLGISGIGSGRINAYKTISLLLPLDMLP